MQTAFLMPVCNRKTFSDVSYSFRKTQRIKKPAEFQQVYKNRQWGNTECFTFNVLAVDSISQLGVTVSKKVSKLAVRRNHIKRLVKEYYRLHQSDLKAAKLVITVKPAAKNKENPELWNELEQLWAKLMKWQRWHQHQSSRNKGNQSR